MKMRGLSQEMLYPGHQVNSFIAVWCAVGLEGLFLAFFTQKVLVFSSPINMIAIPSQLRGEFNGTLEIVSQKFF